MPSVGPYYAPIQYPLPQHQSQFQTPYSAPLPAPALSYNVPLAPQNAVPMAPSASKSDKDRPFTITMVKMAAECGVGLGSFYAAKPLGVKYLTKLGEHAALGGGVIGAVVGGALTGAVFSGVYQKMKTGTINTATFIKDTLLGAIGC